MAEKLPNVRVFKNSFLNGLQKDLDYAITPNDKFVDAHNVFISGSDKFLALENIAGTEEIGTLVSSFTNGYVLAVYANKYTIGSTTDVECLTIFTAQVGGDFKILCYDLENTALYELFTEDFTTEFENSIPVVDGVVYPENGVDILYFTDNFNEIRKLRCEISTPYVANSLQPSQLSLQRRATLAHLELDDVLTSGGSLLCGGYQFSLRFFNETTRTYSKWTIPSHPINISRVVESDELGEGGYGMTSTKRIQLKFQVPTEEVDFWTHYQFAVIEGVAAVNGINASLLKLENLTDEVVVGEFNEYTFVYDSNIRIDFVPLEEIVVDLAAIDKVKTLQVKNNRLFAGNVTYTQLEYDREPAVIEGEVVTQVVDNKNDLETSNFRGYFRDEVYRFYVSYFDEKYNFSRPTVLQLQDVLNNDIGQPPPGTNVFTNGTFTGSAAGWSQTGSGNAWVYASNSINATVPGLGSSSQTIYQSVVVDAGSYKLDYQILGATGSAVIYLIYLNGTTVIGSQALSTTIGTFTGISATVPATTTGVGFRCTTGFDPGTAILDSVSFYKVPQGTVGGFDMRFPSRKAAGFTLLNTSDEKQYLNLDLTISNHPSWARGFVILRAKRKKRIKFQTPFVPSSLVEGIEVIGKYPGSAIELGGDASTVNENILYPNATPMSPIGTLMPKNYFSTVRKDMVRQQNTDGTTRTQKGEVYIEEPLIETASNSVYYVYPPNIYATANEDITYGFSQGDSYEAVDYAFLKANVTSYQTSPYGADVGEFINTSVNGSFYATGYGDYYYDPTTDRADPFLPQKTGSLTDYKELDAFGEGTTLAGVPVGQYDKLETGGIFYNQKPNNQRAGVMKLGDNKTDTAIFGNSVYGGDQVTSCTGQVVMNSGYEVALTAQSNKFVNAKSGYVNGTSVASIVDIVNVVNQYDDDRYGDASDIHDLIYTGASYVFNATEVAQVVEDGQVPISLRIAGGDCYVSFQQFKITDSHYGLINVEKKGAGVLLSGTDLLRRWDRLFFNASELLTTDTGRIISMPVTYKNVSQVVALHIESEVLGDITDVRPYNETIASDEELVVNETDNEYSLRVPFSYGYNKNYSNASNQKAFIPFDPNELITTRYKARILFSDQKIYNTDIAGFDLFRTSNFYDLEETYGGITKLALAANEMYGLQEKAVVYIPVDARVIETADAGTMQVRTGSVIDIPIYISRIYGCQHLKGVRISDDSVFFPDNGNQSVLKLHGQSLELIHENGMVGEFSSLFGTKVAENELFGLYDNNRRHYWVALRTAPACWVYDDRFQCWVSNYEFREESYFDGVFAYNHLWVLGNDEAGNLNVYRMYTGDYSQLLGTPVTPRVSFSVNPDFELAKTFDNVILYSSDKLDTMDIKAEKETGASGGEALNMDIDVDRREGDYRVAVIRDINDARIRGTRATSTVRWRAENEKVTLSGVVTKYRLSWRPV